MSDHVQIMSAAAACIIDDGRRRGEAEREHDGGPSDATEIFSTYSTRTQIRVVLVQLSVY